MIDKGTYLGASFTGLFTHTYFLKLITLHKQALGMQYSTETRLSDQATVITQ